MSHWVTAMTDFGDVTSLDPAKNRRLFKLVDKLGAVVKAATVARPGEVVATGVPCGGRVGRVPCPGYLDLHRQQVPEQIEWNCQWCPDSGVIHDFRGTIWDLTPNGAPTAWDGEWRQVLVSPNEYDAVRAIGHRRSGRGADDRLLRRMPWPYPRRAAPEAASSSSKRRRAPTGPHGGRVAGRRRLPASTVTSSRCQKTMEVVGHKPAELSALGSGWGVVLRSI